MHRRSQPTPPIRRRPIAARRIAAPIGIAAVVASLFALGAPATLAAGDASRAAGFIESAQNMDGGFGARRHRASDPRATLWASVALLAAKKNPRDEFLRG